MKIYLIRNKFGGLDGPTTNLEQLKNYTPPNEFKNERIELNCIDNKEEKVLYVWDWAADNWVEPLVTRYSSGISIDLAFGAMAPPLSTQLEGTSFTEEQIDQWQKDADAITRLRIRGYISRSVAEHAIQKIIRSMKK